MFTRFAPGPAHRAAITVADVLPVPTVGARSAIADADGTLANATPYYSAVAAGSRWGTTPASAAVSQNTGGSGTAVRVPITKVNGADAYDLFLSTDAQPKHVGRITEAQRAAGCRLLTANGTAGGDGPNELADKARTALALDADVDAFFTVSGTGAELILTAKTKAANDATLNIASADGTAVGVTAAPTSANTTAGVAPVQQVETATVVGGPVISQATLTVTAAGMTNSPKTVAVDVVAGDTAAQVATKARAALAADVDVAAFFTVGGATTDIILTALVQAADDATLNVASDNDTCGGLTAAPTSVDTTAGVAPVKQKETATLVGTIVDAGDATITVTAAGMTNSPKAIPVAVAALDDAAAIAGKVRTALAADVDVAAFFTVGGATDQVILEALTAAADDATLNIASDNGTCTGLTAQPTSADTTAGVAGVAQVETATLVGGPVTSTMATIVTAAGMTGTPKTVLVDVLAGDTAAQVAGKIRTALAADVDVAAFFTVGGASATVALTALTAAADDATLNIATDNDTCGGLTAAPTSVDTTAGVAGTLQVETATFAGLVTTDGTLLVTVTAAGMANSPKAVAVDVTAVGAIPGAVDIGVVGTGLARNVDPFVVNSAYAPGKGITPATLSGYTEAALMVKLAVNDLGVVPTLTLLPFVGNGAPGQEDDWHQLDPIPLTFLGAVGKALEREVRVDVGGAGRLVVLVDGLAGNGAAVTIWVEGSAIT